MTADLDNFIKLKVGDNAPDFTALNQNGESFNLNQILKSGQKVMLVFYPADFTSGCTKQLCGIRDVYQEYADLGIKIVGINKGNAKSHQKFIAEYKYQFDILVDENNQIRDKYGAVKNFFKNLTVKRGVFLIGTNGKIDFIYWGQQDNQAIIDMLKKDAV